MTQRLMIHVLTATALAVSCAIAGADVGRTQEGIWFSVGGIGDEEAARFAADSADHALSLRVAARGSGGYLADVDLQIVDGSNRRVFQHHLDGPWLLIDLPPGRYELVGEYDGEVARLDVVVPARGSRSAVMYFPVPGEVRPFREDQP